MKGYRQFCAASRALDVLGDRWALLVVRELLFGPRRYTDLLTGLPGIGSSVLTTRLRDLEQANLVARRRLPPPAAVLVYELTNDGEDLRSVIDALTRWGLRLMDHPTPDDTIRASWLALSLCVSVRPIFLPADGELELRLDGEPHTVRERAGRLEARWGHAARPIAVVQSSIEAMYLIVSGQNKRDDLQAREAFIITGDQQIGEAFLDAVHAAWRSPALPAD
jgi:DNA-binding HxlR family transcriptional regulator